MLKRILPLSCVLAAMLNPQLAAAQVSYKSTMPDGKVIYGDKPVPGAAKVETRNLNTSKAGVVPPSDREKAVVQQLEADRNTRQLDEDRVRKAEIAVHEAEVALEMGKEPQPNERLGTAGGGSRLTDGYWTRQKNLEAAVELARRNLERVRSGK